MAKQQRPDGHHEDETIPTRWIISQRYQSSGATAAVSRTTTYYYFHYYAVQASYQAGREYWANWHPRVRELFLDKQDADGSRDVPGGSEGANVVGPNKIYWTSMATLVLEIYMHFLPAYQR